MEETTRLLDQWGFLLVRALRRNQSQSESLLELVRVGLEVVGMGGGRGKQVIETWRV
jgi:preprotein translocase subunit YajC